MHEINSLLRRGKNPAVLNAIKLSVRRQMQSYLSRFVLFKGMSMSFSFVHQTVHKKTFYYLEQLILKHKLHQNALNIKEIHGRSMIYDYVHNVVYANRIL